MSTLNESEVMALVAQLARDVERGRDVRFGVSLACIDGYVHADVLTARDAYIHALEGADVIATMLRRIADVLDASTRVPS